MADPARKTPLWEIWTSDDEVPDEEGVGVVQRWVEGPDGQVELLELPLTPEYFLDPQLGDKMVQGGKHSRALLSLYELMSRHLRPENGFTVLSDVKHLLGRGLSAPAPDISVLRWLPEDPDDDLQSYDFREHKIAPCLIIEVVSPSDPRVRLKDEVDKVRLYERIGVQEYLLVDPPRKRNGNRYRMKGYRLDGEAHYQPIEPDSHGRLESATTGLAFGPSPDGREIHAFDLAAGERLLGPWELAEAQKASELKAEQATQRRKAAEQATLRAERAARQAEETAKREAKARKAAEHELAHLREEIQRLKKQP
jgi:Uma2 family endonuclease